MTHLKLKLLGSYRLTLDGQLVDSLESDKERAMLAYLAVESGRLHPREKLIDMFWPGQNEEHARGSLSQAIYHLRGVLGDRAQTGMLPIDPSDRSREPFLLVTSHDIQLNPQSGVEVDVIEFKRIVSASREHAHARNTACEECLKRCQEAARLYTGEFLDGFYLPKSLVFEEWATVLREQLRLEAMEVHEQLVMAFEQRGELEQALGYARRMVVLDELGEAGYGHVMRLLALLGRRSEALAEFDSFRQVLAIQIGAEPGMETRQLYQRLRVEEGETALWNLPANLTPFVGRRKELEELWGWLRDPERRLISILGAGGSGKTRLALEAARRQRYLFKDGVYFVPLSVLGAGSSLLAAIAESMDFTFRDLGDHKRQMQDYLRNKKILLILDSFETVVGNSGLVAEILSASAGSKALVTSRVRLNLSGDQVYLLEGMHYPPQSAREKITEYSAVELFLDAARRVKPDFVPANMDSIAKICRLVEGMPLSLLLASSWVNEFPEQEIAEQIGRGLDFLAVEWADLPERQRSLRATFEYSWNLLSKTEQQGLMNIAVFHNPFTAQAAHHVASANPQLLHALVGKSLLGSITEGKYQMHDLVHQYSLEILTLTQDAQEKTVRQQHCDYFLEQVAGWARVFKSAQQVILLSQADKEIDDVKAAWLWAAQQKSLEQLFSASEGLLLYYFLRYRFQEGERACQLALEGVNSASEGGERLNLVGWLLAWQVHFNRLLGKVELARQITNESMEKLSRAETAGQDTRYGQAVLLRERGYLASNLLEQTDYFQRSAELFQALGDSWWQAMVLSFAGEINSRIGDRSLALEQHHQAVALSREAGEPRLLARSLMYLAYDHLIHWDWKIGAQMMEEATDWFRSVGDLGSMATGELHLGVSLGWTGRLQESCKVLEQALAKMHQLGDRFYIAYCTLALGVIQMYSGRYAQAELTLLEALCAARQGGFLREVASGLSQTGCLSLVQGKPAKGLVDFEQSVASLRQMRFAGELGMALGGLALAQHLFGQEERAWVSLEESLRIAFETHSRFLFFTLGATVPVLLVDSGKWELAVEAYSALRTDPIISNSQWTTDMIGNRMDFAREQLSEDVFLAAEKRGRESDIFAMLGRLEKVLSSNDMVIRD